MALRWTSGDTFNEQKIFYGISKSRKCFMAIICTLEELKKNAKKKKNRNFLPKEIEPLLNGYNTIVIRF